MSRNPPTASWLVALRPLPDPRIRLLCLPFAGGAASFYRSWSQLAVAGLEVWAAELPGRGRRMLETPVRRFSQLVDSLQAAIEPLMERPLVLFGHSMGAELAFEVGCRLERAGYANLCHLVVSGRPPYARAKRRRWSQLSDAAFLREVQSIGGLPDAVVQDQALRQLALPGLRADFEALEHWRPPEQRMCGIPITVLGGDQDDYEPTALRSWAGCTRASSTLHMFPGDHFFVQSERASVLEQVRLTVETCLRRDELTT